METHEAAFEDDSLAWAADEPSPNEQQGAAGGDSATENAGLIYFGDVHVDLSAGAAVPEVQAPHTCAQAQPPAAGTAAHVNEVRVRGDVFSL